MPAKRDLLTLSRRSAPCDLVDRLSTAETLKLPSSSLVFGVRNTCVPRPSLSPPCFGGSSLPGARSCACTQQGHAQVAAPPLHGAAGWQRVHACRMGGGACEAGTPCLPAAGSARGRWPGRAGRRGELCSLPLTLPYLYLYLTLPHLTLPYLTLHLSIFPHLPSPLHLPAFLR